MKASLSSFFVLDLESGTFFSADRACLINVDQLSDDQLEAFCEGTDTDRVIMADQLGRSFRPC